MGQKRINSPAPKSTFVRFNPKAEIAEQIPAAIQLSIYESAP